MWSPAGILTGVCDPKNGPAQSPQPKLSPPQPELRKRKWILVCLSFVSELSGSWRGGWQEAALAGGGS
ncbi:Uncharacterized protein HZ326_19583 [Fusarium oxysporum f. sp. albedinis]|nr:Uncharacterized protein HZ326_19583 [Fusarium oxysporum f. sp. albedinis]